MDWFILLKPLFWLLSFIETSIEFYRKTPALHHINWEKFTKYTVISFTVLLLAFKIQNSLFGQTDNNLEELIESNEQTEDEPVEKDEKTPFSPVQPEILPLASQLTSPFSLLIPPEVIKKEFAAVVSKLDSKNSALNLRNISHSMQHYLFKENYQSICAMDLGKPFSFCAYRTEVCDKDGSCPVVANFLLNLNITHRSKDTVLQEEFSHFCQQSSTQTPPSMIPSYVPRSTSVYAEYHNKKGNKITKQFKGKESYILQQMWDLNRGKLACK